MNKYNTIKEIILGTPVVDIGVYGQTFVMNIIIIIVDNLVVVSGS